MCVLYHPFAWLSSFVKSNDPCEANRLFLGRSPLHRTRRRRQYRHAMSVGSIVGFLDFLNFIF